MGMSNLALEVNGHLEKQNAEQGKEIQQTLGGAVMGLAALGAVFDPNGIANALSPEDKAVSVSSGKAMLAANMSTDIADIPADRQFGPEVGPGQAVAQRPRIDQGQGMGIGGIA